MSTWVVSELPGRTRNISRGGLGILVRRTFAIGEAIEVEIESPERGPFFMAGRVAFCRYAGQTYYEVGIALKSAQASPIFSVNPALAFEMLHWLELPTQAPPNKPQ
jgi:Tfp pilus assembly protein PilZ